MEILFRGTPPEEKEYTGECYYCKTKVKFKAKEGKTTYDQRDGNFISISCPVCNKPITVSV